MNRGRAHTLPVYAMAHVVDSPVSVGLCPCGAGLRALRLESFSFLVFLFGFVLFV